MKKFLFITLIFALALYITACNNGNEKYESSQTLEETDIQHTENTATFEQEKISDIEGTENTDSADQENKPISLPTIRMN